MVVAASLGGARYTKQGCLVPLDLFEVVCLLKLGASPLGFSLS